MAPSTEKKLETPYALEVDEAVKNVKDLEAEPSTPRDDEDNDVFGLYVAKNWLARRKFASYPQQGYKPVFLKDLNDKVWFEFDREVQHYQSYFSLISWYYKIWTLGPVLWFLVMVLPDLLWYYDILFRGVGVVCGAILAIAFTMDTYLQRRLLRKKLQPMYAKLIATYRPRFLLHGFVISYEFEQTMWEGMNSYILFRRSNGEDYGIKPGDGPKEMGFYLDEDLMGKMPYALGVASRIHPPRFLQGVSEQTWTALIKAIDKHAATPRTYLLGYTIAMGLIVGSFVFALIYSVVVFTRVRHWLLIACFPIFELLRIMNSFRRRHYVENVLATEMREVLTFFEPSFAEAGFGLSFELEYVFHYFVLDTYVNFWKLDSKYDATPGGSMT